MLTQQQIKATVKPDLVPVTAPLTIADETRSVECWLNYYGVSKPTYYRRMKAGKTALEAVTKRPMHRGRRVSQPTMCHADHKRAFLLRLAGKTYTQIGWALNTSTAHARALVLLPNQRQRLTIEAEFMQ